MNATAPVACDWYELLGIPPHADAEEIRQAYRSAAKKHHPDAGGDPSGRTFQVVHEAYAVLSDPAKRRAYDRQRRQRPGPVKSSSRGTSRRARPADWAPGSAPSSGPAPQQAAARPRTRRRHSAAGRFGSVLAVFLCIGLGLLLVTVSAAGAKDLASRPAHDPAFSEYTEYTLAPTDQDGSPAQAEGLFAYASPFVAGQAADEAANESFRQQISVNAPFSVPEGGFQKDALRYQM